ncbi:MAG: RagB/SusD family nutrient uptake outer membrane protein [Chitinophagaceae bacterium]|nr:RagB/SusD family nutrient uptake outer membrane protein [Chitinophagaceae bacterium]
MKITNRTLTYLFILVTGGSACKKFVQIDPPRTQLVAATVFSNNSTAIAALTSIYAQMSSMADICWFTGMSSDEFINYGTLPYANVYANALIENDGDRMVNFVWTAQYNFIYQANALIEGLRNSTGVSEDVRRQLLGEAKFIRAFWHFYLVNLYGDIPIVTSTDYKTNLAAPRSPVSKVYQQIIADLKEAQDLLSEKYVDGANMETVDRVRPTKWAAMAMLARVYLFSGDWANAEDRASAVISHSPAFSLPPDLNSVFLKNSPEAIWQLKPAPERGYNTDEGKKFILTDIPNGAYGVSLNTPVLAAFEPGDRRRTDWVDSITVSGTEYYFPYKYKVSTGSTITEYSMVIRLAELYLIRAEARAQQDRPADAAADLDLIRNRAGLPGTTAGTKAELLTAVLHERQVELFTEGHRWLDLKRTNTVDLVMTIVTPLKGSNTWKSYQQLYPIPRTDIKNSINLKQNPGY